MGMLHFLSVLNTSTHRVSACNAWLLKACIMAVSESSVHSSLGPGNNTWRMKEGCIVVCIQV